MLKERQQSNIRRYEHLYGINPYQPELYDFVIDTGKYSVQEVADMIISAYETWVENEE